MDITANPMVRILSRFQHAPRTDVAKQRINNPDFIVLCLYALGPFGLKELRVLSGNWRKAWGGKPDFRVLDSYFTPHYGYTATDFTGGKRYGGRFSSAPRRAFKWYRKVAHLRAGVEGPKMRRYQNGLTMAGVHRAEELVLLLSGHKKA